MRLQDTAFIDYYFINLFLFMLRPVEITQLQTFQKHSQLLNFTLTLIPIFRVE